MAHGSRRVEAMHEAQEAFGGAAERELPRSATTVRAHVAHVDQVDQFGVELAAHFMM
ncbi:hypothetical protein [Caballeronia choica]|jgi:hypothetical protein|uniref:hypothetical protein n=1 Tax=Caballeronia choica TaxID=326476 RepID=UPI00135AA580|nr:hypothetical protein [Caballeronia choica]